ncbi:unnamed protein product [Absidia cylindrospora]
MECTDPYFFLLLDNINVPSYSDLHEKSIESTEFQSRHNDFYTGMLSPNSQIPASVEMSPLSTNSTLSYSSDLTPQTLMACFPSPTSSIIEPKKHSPLLEARTVKSHQIDSIQYHYPPPKKQPIINAVNPHLYQQSILTSIDTSRKKKKMIGKKQKRINELPYAPNLLNLQLTPAFNSAGQQHKKNGSKNQTPSSSSLQAGEGGALISSTIKTSSPSPSSNKSASTYRCDYPDCEKTFTRPYNLKSHRRTHTAERPFDCPLCPKSFARQHDRNRHAKLHLGIKPYTCHFCNKSFARQDALNRHQRTTNTNANSSPIPSCGRSVGGRRKANTSSYSSSSFPFCHL